MATGRGQAGASFSPGLEEQARVQCSGNQPTYKCIKPKNRFLKARCKLSTKRSIMLPITSAVPRDKTRHGSQNYIERMPTEVLQRILLLLDAASLLCIGYVNKRFHELANSNHIWYKMYSCKFGKGMWRPMQMEELSDTLDSTSVQEKLGGYWRSMYFRKMTGCNENKWQRELKRLNPHTGLPSQTKQVLRSLGVQWEITVTDRRGRERSFGHSSVHFFESSVTVCWNNGNLPDLKHIASLNVHAVRRASLDCSAVPVRPGFRSLLLSVDGDAITKDGTVIGCDQLVKLFSLNPGHIIGVWRGQWSLAFVMVNFHFHKLVERSLLGSSICPYTVSDEGLPFDDVDPEYGLHGYTLHISLHNMVQEIMSGRFSQLFCKKAQIHNGFIKLIAINKRDLSEQTPLSGEFCIPWESGVLQGSIQDCCILSVTILDEANNPFWCVSTVASLILSSRTSVSYYLDGDDFYIKYQDSDGKVILDLVWLKEHQQFFLVNLLIYLATAKVNKHFGREY